MKTPQLLALALGLAVENALFKGLKQQYSMYFLGAQISSEAPTKKILGALLGLVVRSLPATCWSELGEHG